MASPDGIEAASATPLIRYMAGARPASLVGPDLPSYTNVRMSTSTLGVTRRAGAMYADAATMGMADFI